MNEPKLPHAAPVAPHEIADHLDNHDTPSPILHQIAHQQPGSDEFHKLSEHPNTGEETLRHIHQATNSLPEAEGHEIRNKVLQHPNAPTNLVHEAFGRLDPHSYDHGEHGDLVMHPKVDPASRERFVKAVMAHSPKVPKGAADDSPEAEHAKSYEQSKEELASNYSKHPDSNPKAVAEMVKHPNMDVASSAVAHPKLATKDHMEFVKRKDFDPKAMKHMAENVPHADSQTLEAGYNKIKGMKRDEDNYYGTSPEDAYNEVLQHPNAPKNFLDAEIKKKPSKDNYYSSDSSRALAMQHPSVDSDLVSAKAVKGDADAVHAAIKRPDTDEATLRALADKHKEHGRHNSMADDIVKHPNFPPDMMMQKAKGSADEARALLKRPELPENVLKELVNHKNQNVAVEALKHGDVTPEVVQHAYKRKAGEVSRAAMNHELATDDMKMERAGKDPVAAAQVAKTTTDPKTLQALHDAHPENHELNKVLTNNPHTPSKVLARAAEFENSEKMPKRSFYNLRSEGDKEKYDSLRVHPNLDEKTRRQMMQSDPHATIKNPSLGPDEIKQGLEYVKGRGGAYNDKYRNSSFNAAALGHPNLSPESAKDLVQGKYGDVSGSNSAEFAHIHDKPETFTPDVINAGLTTNPELTNASLVHEMAKSPHLSQSAVKQYLNKPMPGEGAGRDDNDHYNKMMGGLLNNPNAPKGAVSDALHNPGNKFSDPEIQAQALQSPHATADDIKSYYTDHLGGGENKTPYDDRQIGEALSSQVNKHGLLDHALQNARDPEVVNKLLLRGSGGDTRFSWGRDRDRSEAGRNFESALNNPNPGVAQSAVTWHGGSLSSEDTKRLVDPLAAHKNPEVAKAAYEHMSPEGQKKAMAENGFDQNDPAVIKGMNQGAMKDFKINPDMPQEAVGAVLSHPNASKEHFEQAIAHSPEAAMDVNHRINKDQENNSRNRRKFSKEAVSDLQGKMMDAHSDHGPLMNRIAQSTKDPEIIKRMASQPDKFGHAYGSLMDNDNSRLKDFDGVENLRGPEHSQMMGSLANHPKTPNGIIQNIAKNYPEHHAALADHNRASNADTLKTLLKNPDPQVKANLVNNQKIPQGVKDELLKDPKVMLLADEEHATPEALEPHASSDDLDMVNRVAGHRKATPDIRSKAVKNALGQMQENSEKAKQVLETASHKNIDDDTQEKLAMQDPEYAKNIMRHMGDQITPELGHKILDRYQDHAKKNDVLQAMYEGSHGAHDGKLLSRMMDMTDLDQKLGDKQATSQIADTLQHSEGSGPEHYEKALDMLQAKRGPEYVYKGDAEDAKGDGKLLRELARNGHDNVYSKLVGHPGLRGHLLQNKNLSKPHFEQIAEAELANPKLGKDGLSTDRMRDIIQNPQADSKTLEQVYNRAEGQNPNADPESAHTIVDDIAKSDKISPELASKIYHKHKDAADTILRNHSLPAEDVKDYVQGVLSGKKPDSGIGIAAKHPAFKLSMMDGTNPSASQRNQVYSSVADNFHADPKDLEKIYETAFKEPGRLHGSLAGSLVKNPHTSESIAKDMLEKGHVTKEDMFHNPAVGGQLWRAEKHEFPTDVPGIEPGKEINEAVFKPHSEKVKSIMDTIPEGGHLDWAQFKNAPETKGLAGNPIIQKMFTSAPKQRLDKDHAQKYLDSMPSKDFHVSYKKWDGMQRHNEHNNQLVMQVNNGKSIDDQVSKDRAMNGLYRFIQSASQNSGHPVNPQSIGWSRIDTSHPEHWFIDELQSDLGSELSREMHSIEEDGHSGRMADYGFNPEEGKKAVNKLVDNVHGWDKAGLQTVIDLAKKHGVKKVSIHSGQSKTAMNKGDKAQVTNKYDKIYNRLPAEFGFQADNYDNLPMRWKGDSKQVLKGKPVWTLDVSGKKPGDKK